MSFIAPSSSHQKRTSPSAAQTVPGRLCAASPLYYRSSQGAILEPPPAPIHSANHQSILQAESITGTSGVVYAREESILYHARSGMRPLPRGSGDGPAGVQRRNTTTFEKDAELHRRSDVKYDSQQRITAQQQPFPKLEVQHTVSSTYLPSRSNPTQNAALPTSAGPLIKTGESPGHLSLVSFYNHPGMLEGTSFTERPSPSSLRNVGDLWLPGSSPKLPLSSNYQQAFSLGPPLLDPSGRHYHFPSPHESPHTVKARASLMFESSGIMSQGYTDGSAEMSGNSHGSTLPSLHQDEGEASSNFQSAVQANLPVVATPSFASDQGALVDGDPDQSRCYPCDVSFGQKKALNRHNKDRHTPRNICPLCGTFTWSSGRNYLFPRHLMKCHPEDARAYDLAAGTPSHF
ncbi:hypothetical protein EI94DRAFT_1801820 [Lactarius quietus]|nr:hypothetical protein EI94DRAFT_1801820 [Lactarius quietus]